MTDGDVTTPWEPDAVLALLRAGDTAAAAARAAARCDAAPADAEAWFLRGAAAHQGGDEKTAIAAFEEARRLAPADPRPRGALGALLGARGHHAEAFAVFAEALAQTPDNPRLNVNAGVALEALGRDAEALAHYDRALAVFPGMGDALQNRIALELRRGRADAVAADAARLVTLFPNLAEARQLAGACALGRGALREALAHYERACVLADEQGAARAEPWTGRAVAHATLGQLDAAEAALAHARSIDAAAVERYGRMALAGVRSDGPLLDARRIYLVAGWERQRRCNWRDRDAFVADFTRLVAASTGSATALRDRALVFVAQHLPLAAPTRAALAADVAAEVHANVRALPRPRVRPAAPRTRLRIGYLSPNFRAHPGNHVFMPLVAHHDRARFEFHALSLHRSDADVQDVLAAHGIACHDLAACDDAAAAAAIAALGIDILIDAGGYLQHGRAEILALRPAPLVIGYAGFPGSLGPGLCDYVMSDRIASPEPTDAAFSEALIRLPHAHLLADGTLGVAPPRTSRADHGLRDDAVVLACHNNPSKIEPRVFDAWMRILQACPQTQLWLLEGLPHTAGNLAREAAARDVDPARLVFAPRIDVPSYRSRLRHADVYLDTFVCSAHVTANDVLLAGVPMVTLNGAQWPGRIGASQASAAGLGALVCADAERYVELARVLVDDPEQRARLRRMLASRTAPLFDTVARVHDFERGVLAAWERCVAGAAPAPIDVPPA